MKLLTASFLCFTTVCFAQLEGPAWIAQQTQSARVEVPIWSNLVDSATETFGNLSSYKYVSTSITNPCSYEISRVQVLLFRQGSAAYNITNSVWSNASAAPNALLASATNVVVQSSLTTSAATNTFWYASGTILTVGQTNHLVLAIDTVDASNYGKFRYLVTAGQGGNHSSAGSSWAAYIPGNSWWFVIYGYPQ